MVYIVVHDTGLERGCNKYILAGDITHTFLGNYSYRSKNTILILRISISDCGLCRGKFLLSTVSVYVSHSQSGLCWPPGVDFNRTIIHFCLSIFIRRLRRIELQIIPLSLLQLSSSFLIRTPIPNKPYSFLLTRQPI